MWEAKGKPVDLCFHGQTRMLERSVPEHLAVETIDSPHAHWTHWVRGLGRCAGGGRFAAA
jgi:hypothetical protein